MSSPIRLYGPRAAPIVEKVVRGLALKGLPFEHYEPRNLEDHRRLSASGLLPVIEIEGERIEDSTAILLRIDQLWPEPPLLSRDPRIAATQRRFAGWADECFIWYWQRWQRVRPDGPRSDPSLAAAIYGQDPPAATPDERLRDGAIRHWLGRRPRARRSDEATSEAVRVLDQIGQRVDDMATLLAGRPFFYARSISMADLAAYAMLRSLAEDAIPGSRTHLERRPQLLEFMKRVEEATG